jgi:hypothetical protein
VLLKQIGSPIVKGTTERVEQGIRIEGPPSVWNPVPRQKCWYGEEVHRGDVSLAKISAAQKVARFSSFATARESLNLIKNCFEDREVLARAGTGVRACCAYVSRICYV